MDWLFYLNRWFWSLFVTYVLFFYLLARFISFIWSLLHYGRWSNGFFSRYCGLLLYCRLWECPFHAIFFRFYLLLSLCKNLLLLGLWNIIKRGCKVNAALLIHFLVLYNASSFNIVKLIVNGIWGVGLKVIRVKLLWLYSLVTLFLAFFLAWWILAALVIIFMMMMVLLVLSVGPVKTLVWWWTTEIWDD